MRAAMNAIFYLLRTVCPWRCLPRDEFPPCSAVCNIFRKFRAGGHLGGAAMPMPSGAAARSAVCRFAERFKQQYPPAVSCLCNDLDGLLACFRYKSEDQRRKVMRTTLPSPNILAMGGGKTMAPQIRINYDSLE
jgi:hypothetical protein